jgi:hypothetical protein
MDKMQLEIPTHIETDRLILRRYEPGDGLMYFTVGQRNRQHLQQFEAENCILSAKTQEEAENLIRGLHADWIARNSFFMGAFDIKTLEFIGQIYM